MNQPTPVQARDEWGVMAAEDDDLYYASGDRVECENYVAAHPGVRLVHRVVFETDWRVMNGRSHGEAEPV